MEIWEVRGSYFAGLMHDSPMPWNCGMFLSKEKAEAYVVELKEKYPYDKGNGLSPFSGKGYHFSVQGPYQILDWENNDKN